MADARRDRVAVRLMCGWAALLLLAHVAALRLRTGPSIVADEPGYLFAVRVLAGHGAGPLRATSYYHAGWSLLLVPVELLTSDPHAVFVAAQLLNALLAAAVVPLLFVALRRHASVPVVPAAAAAAVAGTFPSLHVLSEAALPEALLSVLVLLIALCLGRLAETGRLRDGLLLGLLLAYAYAVHGRGVALVAVGLVAVAVLWRRGRLPLPTAVAAAVTAALGGAAAVLLDRHLRLVGYDGAVAGDVGGRLQQLEQLRGIGGFLRALVGQSWYCAVASLGVLPLLAARWRDPVTRARAGVPVLATAAGAGALLVLSAGSLAVASRADHLVYGRYVEPALLLPIAFGVSELLRRRPTRTELRGAAAAVAVLTAATAGLRAGFLPSAGPNRWNVAALPMLTRDLGPVVLVAAGAVATAVLAVCALAGRRLVPIALLAAYAAVAGYGQLVPVRSAERAVYGSAWTDPAAGIADGAVVAVSPRLGDVAGRYAYPWFVRGDVTVDDGADFVFAGTDAVPAGWRRVWSGPRGVALYDTRG